LERREFLDDPLRLVGLMRGSDEKTGEAFSFSHVAEPLLDGEVPVSGHSLGVQGAWRWQRLLGELIRDERRLVVLKGRQIGVTWLYLAVDVAEALLFPGTTSLIYRQREDEAIDNVRRWWLLFQSLPPRWKNQVQVLSPERSVEPGREGVKLLFSDGRISRVVPMTSAAASGHGRTVRRALLDEAGHIEKLSEIRAAIGPAAGQAKIGLVSTANGRSNPETGEGNEFHRAWVTAEESGYTRIFLPYDAHPERDEAWYEKASEVQELKPHQRHAQYPRNEHEAFALTSRVFFDPETLDFYRGMVRKPARRVALEPRTPRVAAVVDRTDGPWKLFSEPEVGRGYAIAADVATGRGADYSTAVVVDLTDMSIAAQFRAKIDSDLFSRQLHYMGRRYNTALIAVETAGGYGEAVIIPLRDGREGRPAYPKLYRHVLSSRPDLPISKPYGFPTNMKTRPLILNQLEKAARERLIPYVTSELLFEMESFVYHDTGTSPRAQEGANDDLVMAYAIGLEMYRLRGHHPHRPRRQPETKYKPVVSLAA
jgi:hypothetical protein